MKLDIIDGHYTRAYHFRYEEEQYKQEDDAAYCIYFLPQLTAQLWLAKIDDVEKAHWRP